MVMCLSAAQCLGACSCSPRREKEDWLVPTQLSPLLGLLADRAKPPSLMAQGWPRAEREICPPFLFNQNVAVASSPAVTRF